MVNLIIIYKKAISEYIISEMALLIRIQSRTSERDFYCIPNALSNQYYTYFKNENIKDIHPISISKPPRGVMGPKNFKFLFQYSANDRK